MKKSGNRNFNRDGLSYSTRYSSKEYGRIVVGEGSYSTRYSKEYDMTFIMRLNDDCSMSVIDYHFGEPSEELLKVYAHRVKRYAYISCDNMDCYGCLSSSELFETYVQCVNACRNEVEKLSSEWDCKIVEIEDDLLHGGTWHMQDEANNQVDYRIVEYEI